MILYCLFYVFHYIPSQNYFVLALNAFRDVLSSLEFYLTVVAVIICLLFKIDDNLYKSIKCYFTL